MHPTATPFTFNERALPTPLAVVATVRAGILTKSDLLEDVAQCLRFPDYFGGNWDALEECVRDLSWLPPGAVVLRHDDLPLPGDAVALGTYLAVLGDAVMRWNQSPGRSLVVVFPAHAREQVALLMPSPRCEDG